MSKRRYTRRRHSWEIAEDYAVGFAIGFIIVFHIAVLALLLFVA